jgi:hypothetical protein
MPGIGSANGPCDGTASGRPSPDALDAVAEGGVVEEDGDAAEAAGDVAEGDPDAAEGEDEVPSQALSSASTAISATLTGRYDATTLASSTSSTCSPV